MFGIYARLDKDEKNIVLSLAQRERRDPRDQAAWLIRQSLERLGLVQSQKKLVDTRAEQAELIEAMGHTIDLLRAEIKTLQMQRLEEEDDDA